MNKDEALKLALEAVGWTDEWRPQGLREEAITAIKAALTQPEQEPVAWTTMPEAEDWLFVSGNKDPNGKLEGKWFPLYTPSPQREWVGLTEEERAKAWSQSKGDIFIRLKPFAQAIEAKLKEKNTYMNKDAALKLALNALVRADKISGFPNNKQTITAIQEALAQPVQQEALYGMNQDDWKDVVAAIAKVRDGRGIYLGCRPADVFQDWFLALGTAKVKEKNT